MRGEVTFPEGVVGDFVVLRSNGLPTYNFACAVDDAAMEISHVIRAEEHLPNTPRQLMLCEALGETPPRYAHVPLILNRDRTKMSKREGEAAVAVGDWRRAGVVPEALLSYLALLGFHPGDEREVLTRAELLECFALERVGRSGSIFDADKLRWMNAHVLHHADGARAGALGGASSCRRARARCRAADLERLLEARARQPRRCWRTWPASWRRSWRSGPPSSPTRPRALASRARPARCAASWPRRSRALRSGARKGLNPRFAPSARGSGSRAATCSSRRGRRSPGASTARSCRWSPACSAASGA